MRGEYMGVAITSRLVTVLKIHGVFAQSKEIRLGRGLGRKPPLLRPSEPGILVPKPALRVTAGVPDVAAYYKK